MAEELERDDEQLLPPWMTGQPNGPGAIAAPEDSDRPTFGQRIGARPAPQVQPPAPADDQAPPMPKMALDPSKMPSFLRPPDPNSVPTPPSGSSNPNLADLAKKQAQFGKPIDPSEVDPATGKSKYKMGWGQRILGTFANAANGFARNGQPIVNVGPGATNARFDRDESLREKNLTDINTQIGTQEKLDSENEKMYRDAIRQAYEGQVGEARLGTSKAQQETADVKQQLADFKVNQKPVNKIGDAANERTELANQMGLKGEERKNYILTGKMPADREQRQPSELETWMNAFKRDNGRPPTADEISNRKSHTSSKSDQIEKDKDSALQKAEEKATARIDKLKIFDPADRRPAAERKQTIYADLEKEKAQIQKEYETRAAQNASASGRGPAARPGATPAKAPAKIDPNNLPKQVSVGGKLRTVAGYNKQTGKVILAPEGQ